MKKRMISLLLVLALAVGICPAAFASEMPADTYEETIVLVENEEGIYEVANPNVRGGLVVTAKEGGQIYEGNSDNLFMRIDDSRFMKAEELSVDADNYSEFKATAESKQLSSQLLSDIERIMAKVANGEIELEEPLAVYVPEPIEVQSNARSITKTTKTYTGYKGLKYYQELLDCKGNSLEFNVKKPAATWVQYCGQVMKAGAIAVANGIMNTVTGGTWTVLSIFVQSTSDAIQTTQAFTHTAKLFENKYTKYTYLVQAGEYYNGSVIDYTYKYFYENYINVDGENFYSDGKTASFSAKAPNYDKADEYAYLYWTNPIYDSRITKYEYTNTDKSITTYVQSMF